MVPGLNQLGRSSQCLAGNGVTHRSVRPEMALCRARGIGGTSCEHLPEASGQMSASSHRARRPECEGCMEGRATLEAAREKGPCILEKGIGAWKWACQDLHVVDA